MELYYDILRDKITELYYGIILRNHITESYYGIILRKYPYEQDHGDPRGVPGAPWDLREPPGHTPGTSRGGPWDPPGNAKTAICQPIYSARRSRLLHPNPFVATHDPKDSPGPFCYVNYESRALFGSLVRPWGRPGPAMVEQWLPLMPKPGRTLI